MHTVKTQQHTGLLSLFVLQSMFSSRLPVPEHHLDNILGLETPQPHRTPHSQNVRPHDPKFDQSLPE